MLAACVRQQFVELRVCRLTLLTTGYTLPAMTNHRHKPSEAFTALLGSVSAPERRAHYCDRNANVTRWTQPESSSKQEPPVNSAVNARYQAINPQYPQALHAATTLQRVGITQMRPIPIVNIQENEGKDAREDLDEHGEDFDEAWDRAQAYNDYLRELDE